jgi:hypothetical protein
MHHPQIIAKYVHDTTSWTRDFYSLSLIKIGGKITGASSHKLAIGEALWSQVKMWFNWCYQLTRKESTCTVVSK